MRAVIQRVAQAQVRVDQTIVGKIGQGLVVYLGVHAKDTEKEAEKLAHKIAHARVFEDADGKMNLSVQEIQGSILSISQFTLIADTVKGNRPSYDQAARPEAADRLYRIFNEKLREFVLVETGTFQAYMIIDQTNDGPVTLIYETKEEQR